MIDPAYALLIVSCAMLLFGASAAHKLRSVGEFSQTLARYQLLPAGFIRIAGPALGLMELAICLGARRRAWSCCSSIRLRSRSTLREVVVTSIAAVAGSVGALRLGPGWWSAICVWRACCAF